MSLTEAKQLLMSLIQQTAAMLTKAAAVAMITNLGDVIDIHTEVGTQTILAEFSAR